MDPALGTFGSVHNPGAPIAPGVVFFDDFLTAGFISTTGGSKFYTTADLSQWLTTITATGTPTIVLRDNEHGGVVRFANGTADNDLINAQVNGEAFTPAAGKQIIFETRLKVTDVSETDWFVGLAITDTSVMAGCTDYIGFHCVDSTGDIDYAVAKNAAGGAMGVETSGVTTADTAYDTADATFIRLQFIVNGVTSVGFYVNGNWIATTTTNLPDDESLTPTICIRNDGAVSQSMDVDYIAVVADR